jgi:hypothetical protein
MNKISNTRVEIMNAIGKTDDHNLKMVLLLMLGVMEEIGTKIDSIYEDKDYLRSTVLNGHADIHHSDHEWIRHYRVEDVQRLNIISRVEPVMVWAESKIQEEKESKKVLKNSISVILTGIAEKAVWLMLGALVYAIASGFPLAHKLIG